MLLNLYEIIKIVTLASKRTDILKQSKDLFWKHGIRRVSIEEICEKAGCSKMTFYRNFANKIDVAIAVLDRLAAEGKEDYDRIMSENISFRQKITQVVKLKADFVKDISQEFVNDIIASEDPDVLKRMKELQQRGQEDFKTSLREAQESGDIRNDLNLDFVIAYSDKITKLAAEPDLQKFYASPEDLIVALTNIFFSGIEARKE